MAHDAADTRKIFVEITVPANWEVRLDMQPWIEQEIKVDRWLWRWADERLTSHAPVERCQTCDSPKRSFRAKTAMDVKKTGVGYGFCRDPWHDAPPQPAPTNICHACGYQSSGLMHETACGHSADEPACSKCFDERHPEPMVQLKPCPFCGREHDVREQEACYHAMAKASS